MVAKSEINIYINKGVTNILCTYEIRKNSQWKLFNVYLSLKTKSITLDVAWCRMCMWRAISSDLNPWRAMVHDRRQYTSPVWEEESLKWRKLSSQLILVAACNEFNVTKNKTLPWHFSTCTMIWILAEVWKYTYLPYKVCAGEKRNYLNAGDY